MKAIEEIKKEIAAADDKVYALACLPDEEQDALIEADILRFRAERWDWHKKDWEPAGNIDIDRNELQDFLHAASNGECYKPHEVSLLAYMHDSDYRTVIVYDGTDLDDPVEAEDF